MGTPKILITGSQGFIGSKLLAAFHEQNYFVQGPNVDILDSAAFRTVIQSEKWDVVIHLAAISHPPACEKNPSLAFQVNLAGTALLVELLQRYQPHSHLIFASTSQLYASPNEKEGLQEVIFDETRKVSPQNLYALTKWQAELLLKDASERGSLKTTVLRLFNHTHRSQSPDFFLPHLYSVIAQAPHDRRVQVPVGNLDLDRDIGSVRDLVSAFQSAIQSQHESFEVFNICSGVAKNLRKLAEGLAKQLGADIEFVTDASRVRAGEPKKLVGSHQKFARQTGWQPQVLSEEALLADFLKL